MECIKFFALYSLHFILHCIPCIVFNALYSRHLQKEHKHINIVVDICQEEDEDYIFWHVVTAQLNLNMSWNMT